MNTTETDSTYETPLDVDSIARTVAANLNQIAPDATEIRVGRSDREDGLTVLDAVARVTTGPDAGRSVATSFALRAVDLSAAITSESLAEAVADILARRLARAFGGPTA